MFRQLRWLWKEWAQPGRNALQNFKLKPIARQSDSTVKLARNWASNLEFWLWVRCWLRWLRRHLQHHQRRLQNRGSANNCSNCSSCFWCDGRHSSRSPWQLADKAEFRLTADRLKTRRSSRGREGTHRVRGPTARSTSPSRAWGAGTKRGLCKLGTFFCDAGMLHRR